MGGIFLPDLTYAMLGMKIATLPKMALMRRKQIMFLLFLLLCYALFQNIYESKMLPSSVTGDESDIPFLKKSFQRLKLSISKTSIHLHIHDGNDSKVLEAVIGENIKTPLQPRIVKDYDDIFEISFGSSISLRLKFYKLGNETDCYKVFWTTTTGNRVDYDSHQDRVNIGDSYWYGGALMHESYWPLNGKSHSLAPFVTGNSYHNDYGSIQERFWLSSMGSSIFIQYDVPLFVDINRLTPGWLTLVASYKKPYRPTADNLLHLNYTLCSCESKHPKQMFLAAAGRFWKYPLAVPNEDLFRYPTWSTWAAFKRSISSDILISFANKITSHGLRCSQIIIDDGWMTHYGDFKFNSNLFPDPRELVMELRRILNASVSLWVHPFSSCLSRNFWKRDSDGESLWVRSYFDWLPSQIIWWNGLGSLLDLTNDEAFDWYLLELELLQKQYGIDSFKFDAGESTWLPSNGVVKGDLSNPNVYTRLFSEIAYRSDMDGRKSQEVRSLVSSQGLPIFARLIDKNSDWGGDNGIRSIIPQTLTMGIIGYPFVFPDMIGGNGYYGIFIHFTVLPERELFIRWLQVGYRDDYDDRGDVNRVDVKN